MGAVELKSPFCRPREKCLVRAQSRAFGVEIIVWNERMSPPLWQFWSDWSVKAVGAVATLLAVFAALFGAWLRNWLTPPKLILAVVSEAGVEASVYLSRHPDHPDQFTDGLWYHVKVSNERRWNPATDVYVYLVSIEEEDAAGVFQPIWFGNAALSWRHETPPKPKKIGSSAECDLCHILKEPLALYLSPIFPASVNPSKFAKKCRIALILQAKSTEADSDRCRFKISWNGEWPDRANMSQSLVINQEN